MAQTDPQIATPVKRRRVFYIPGYDPFPPRRYRELYRKESKTQAAISDYRIEIKGTSDAGPFGWHVEMQVAGQRTETDFRVLVWSQVVRASMSGSIASTYVQMVKTAWIYLTTGALFRLMRLRKGPILAAVYPVFMLLVQLGIAGGLGFVAATLVGRIFPDGGLISSGIFWIVFLAVGVFVLKRFKARDGKFFAYYLMHDFAFAAKDRGGLAAELSPILQDFRREIEAALDEEVDEVLVVGHSSGALMAVLVLAQILRERSVSDDVPKFSFLSLGQVIPMVSFLPDANQLRADLNLLSSTDDLTWVDVTAPGDGCAFALCDPVAVSGVATDDQKWPLVFSAAFTQSLSPERWKDLRWRFFRLHFQYLCAFDRPKDYDYFQITAGPTALADRYAGRPQSKSRIARAVSGYRSIS